VITHPKTRKGEVGCMARMKYPCPSFSKERIIFSN